MAKPPPKKSVKGKNIIVLSDGTGNSAAKFNKTNVWRTYEALDLSDPKKQVARYYNGVGTSSFRPIALVTGAIGIGLSRNVRELYAFLCRNYEEGDRIYGFGFSRGAFTIRILAGLVTKFGLIDKDNFSGEDDLWKKTTWLFQAYCKTYSGAGMTPLPALIIGGLKDVFATKAKKNFLKDREKLCRRVEIEFLGLWDTVGAYGLPIEELMLGWDRLVWPLSMRNQDLSRSVKKAAHALSLDDERNSFGPVLWNEEGEYAYCGKPKKQRDILEATDIEQEHVTQVWFAGMHADVGGGYPDDYLSYVPLNFVLDQLEKPANNKGEILFIEDIRNAQREAARIMGVIHDSRSGLGSYYRYQPRKVKDFLFKQRVEFRLFRFWQLKPVVTRMVKIGRTKIHHSVFGRIATAGLGYSPIVLPEYYAVVGPDGRIENIGAETFEKSPDDAIKREKAQEKLWDIIWLRRVASSGAHYLTGILVLLPWISILPPATTNAGKCIDSIACPVSDTIKYVGSFLPSYVSKWVDSFAANPMLFVILLGSTLAMMSFSARLDVTIRDRMHAIWHPGPNGIPDADYSKLYKLHESRAYQWWLGSLRYNILPFAFGTSVLISFMFVAVSATSRVSFFVEDYRGLYCSENARIDASVQNLYSGPLTFYPSNICWPTGLLVERGANYRIVMNIADSMGSWKDDTLEADLQGNLENHSPLVGILAWPAKRYLWKNYYKPIARIRTLAGRKASQDEYVLDPTFTSLRNRYDCLVSDFTAQSSGELFLFVNDAVIYY